LHKPTFLDTFIASLRDAAQFATLTRFNIERAGTSRASPVFG
jgi:hypothetical protein